MRPLRLNLQPLYYRLPACSSVAHALPGKLRRLILCLAALTCVTGLIATGSKADSNSTTAAPVLLAQANSARAIALDAQTTLDEPFALTSRVPFGGDDRTRVMLFAGNLTLANGETASAVTAEAQDGALFQYPLTVEYVGVVPGFTWMTAVVVRLNDNLGDVGDVLVGITYQGMHSNRVRIGIGHIGGGPPDDPTPTPTPTPSPTPSPSPTPTPAPTPDLGSGASLHGKQLFPADNPWNQDISNLPVDANSANLIASIGLNTTLHPDFGTVYNGAPNGIPYVVVSGSQPRVPINWTAYGDESDPGPYPVPPNAPIEGGPSSDGDRHVLVIDRDNWLLYELGYSFPVNNGSSWNANCGAIFDLNSNAMRPAGWTSGDAAGLPIFPGLVRYDEVYEQGVIAHALRFTVHDSRRGYVYPARHFASSNTSVNLPPMGMRVRLKASFDISGFSPANQVILRALKKYGMMVADNGSNWYISGAPDPRWNDNELNQLKTIKGSNFEVVQMGAVVTR
jgi:hypothetical protein